MPVYIGDKTEENFKSLDFESKVPTSLHTQPRFLEKSEKLNKKLKNHHNIKTW